jgi:predicted glycosyltransferase
MRTGPVWIDLANSPHVLFFAPVIHELRRRDVGVIVSARDFAQTVALCGTFGINATVVGEHGGAGVAGKGTALVRRAAGLRDFARSARPSVAVSHNSYSHALAARWMRVPLVTAMDYEFQPANHLAFRCGSLVAVPDVFPLDCLRAQGARADRTWRYHGLKEHIALAGFAPDRGYLEAQGIPADRAIVVVRPPADMALYHRFQNPLFERLLRRLAADESLRVVLLPRTPDQLATLEDQGLADVAWRGEPLDGRQLVAGADAVVSAGGSMNREAAVLGTPAYSVFAGRVAAVDRALAVQGRLTFVQDETDVAALSIARKAPREPVPLGDALVRAFVERILQVGH